MTMEVFAMLLAVLVVGCPLVNSAALTGAWTPCGKADPNLNDCMKTSVTKFLPVLGKGIPKIKIPTLDPLQLETLDLSTPSLKMQYTGAQLKNLLNGATVTKVEADVNAYTLRVVLNCPDVISEGNYVLDGKLMVMAVKGEGTFKLEYKDVTLDTTFIGKPTVKDGKTYMELVDVRVEMTPKDLIIQANNLFNGNKELGDAFNKFANENWKEIYDDLKGELWKKLGLLFKSVMRPLFDNVPYNEIYNM